MNDILLPDPLGISRAAALRKQRCTGRLHFEKVLWLGARIARNGTAVAGILHGQGRPSFNRLISHCSRCESGTPIWRWFDTAEKVLASAYPGRVNEPSCCHGRGHGYRPLVDSGAGQHRHPHPRNIPRRAIYCGVGRWRPRRPTPSGSIQRHHGAACPVAGLQGRMRRCR